MKRREKPPIVSLNPLYEADVFLWAKGFLGEEELSLLSKARAIVLPQALRPEIYWLARSLAPVFPNYDFRFRFPGKVGQALAFSRLKIPHPRTIVCLQLEPLLRRHPLSAPLELPPYPFVLKADLGGEGGGTWLIKDKQGLTEVISKLKTLELRGREGFIIQDYLPGLKEDLRVVVIGSKIISYWRRQKAFYHHLARGAEIDYEYQPDLQRRGRALVKKIIKKTGINLAGFDLAFSDTGFPLVLEINFSFGRRGLEPFGGFEKLFLEAIEQFFQTLS
ncbi:ATP-grasp domain-containing protein [Thermosulfuriphilus sp.]